MPTLRGACSKGTRDIDTTQVDVMLVEFGPRLLAAVPDFRGMPQRCCGHAREWRRIMFGAAGVRASPAGQAGARECCDTEDAVNRSEKWW